MLVWGDAPLYDGTAEMRQFFLRSRFQEQDFGKFFALSKRNGTTALGAASGTNEISAAAPMDVDESASAGFLSRSVASWGAAAPTDLDKNLRHKQPTNNKHSSKKQIDPTTGEQGWKTDLDFFRMAVLPWHLLTSAQQLRELYANPFSALSDDNRAADHHDATTTTALSSSTPRFLPDGLQFLHVDCPYVPSLCPLFLVWKDFFCSRFPLDGMIRQNDVSVKKVEYVDVVLRLGEGGMLRTESDGGGSDLYFEGGRGNLGVAIML